MRKYAAGGVLALLGWVLVACGPAIEINRTEASKTVDLSGKWNDSDSRMMAETITQDMMEGGWAREFQRKHRKKPVVIPFGVKNRTSEHINTQTLVKDLERALINSGKARVVSSREQRGEIRDERAEEQLGFTANPSEIGKELGADFVLTGEINSIIDRAGGEAVVFYQGDMELISMETNEKVWLGGHKIKKQVSRKSFRF